jgi:hypothetical protein
MYYDGKLQYSLPNIGKKPCKEPEDLKAILCICFLAARIAVFQ